MHGVASTSAGLSAAEAAARLARDGPNRLPAAKRRSAARQIGHQLFHFFAAMLWVASALAVVAGLPELAVAIVIVIVVNALFAFVQESRADRAAERLRGLLPRRVTVIRDGATVEVDASEVVVGDLLSLHAGDRIPADAVVVAARSALLDTSLLTGESESTAVQVGDRIHAGTFAVQGETDAVVDATGASTRLAAIARMTTLTARPVSPLTRELHRVVRTIAFLAVGVGGLFFTLALLVGTEPADGFVFGVGVTVALVPEALLPTVTLSLAWGAERMAERQVLVRHLDAVETLGSTTFICTDKTGTLTQNQMTVVETWTDGGPVEELARAAVRCSVGRAVERDGEWVAQGDPMEAALDVFGRQVGIDTDGERALVAADDRFPFDPQWRMMAVVARGEVVVKGAPDTVLARCKDAPGAAAAALDALTDKGLRVLAVASRRVDETPPRDLAEAVREMRLLGLVGLEDPPRPDVREAIDASRRAGVKVAMVTGDHPTTAAAIAAEVGLRRGDEPVVCGDDLPTDDALLGALVDRDGIVVARVSPEDKLRIARALRARGHVVAMTGDGVNDGPALHEADIGVAMGRSGTDVAREAADLVLLDDHFASIVAGIEQGRATFVNVRRFLTYHLTDNVAEVTPFIVWALSGGRFPLALGVLQILALDIGTDTLSAVALGAEPPAAHLLERPPVSGRLLDHTVLRRAFALLGPVEAVTSMAAFLTACTVFGWRPGASFPTGQELAAASGAAFMAVVFGQTANAFACRSSTQTPGRLGWTTNRLLFPATAVGLAVSLVMLLVPAVADELGHAVPPAAGWLVALSAAAAVLAADALDKSRRRAALAVTPPR